MKDWNRTGKVKAIVLAILFLPNLIVPIGANPQIGFFIALLIPLAFGSLVTPFLGRINNIMLGREISKPHWNDNPLSFKKPLAFNQFAGYFFITVGLSLTIGSGIKFHFFNQFGLAAISFGCGTLIGNHLALKWKAKQNQ